MRAGTLSSVYVAWCARGFGSGQPSSTVLWMRFLLPVVLTAFAAAGCAHTPETVVHLAAPTTAGWSVREPRGAHVCSLPCSVELDEHETLVVHHAAGKQFVLDQQALGKGVWSGSVRPRKELGRGALVLQSLSQAIAAVGVKIATARSEDRATAGIVLAGVGAAGAALADALPGKTVDELHLEKVASEAR